MTSGRVRPRWEVPDRCRCGTLDLAGRAVRTLAERSPGSNAEHVDTKQSIQDWGTPMNTASAGNKVLVAVDGTPASLQALRMGRQLADLFGDSLVAVTVWEPSRKGLLPTDTVHRQ